VRRSDHYFAVAILAALLVSYHLYLHDLTLLLIPLAAARKHIVAAYYIAPPAFLFTNPHLLWFMGFLLLAPLADGSTPAPLFATQMLAPSKARPEGRLLTVKVPSVAPSLARSLVTLLLF